MSDVEVKREEMLTRDEAAHRLAAARADGDRVEVAMGAGTLKVHVLDQVRCEIELEVDDNEVELELELKWSLAKPRASVPTNSSPVTRTAARKNATSRVSTPAARRARGTGR
jgi:amphi-Trp domain-containing protein